MSRIERFQKRLGYEFQSSELLLEALTHPSYGHEHGAAHYQRLEFLGDAVIGLAASEVLLASHPQASEGELSRRRSAMVNEASLAAIARRLGIGDVLRMGKNARRSRLSDRPLADAYEAVIGAIFVEAGYSTAVQTARAWFTEHGEELAQGDAKSRLQEYTQKRHNDLPKYLIVDESGPPHDRRFEIVVSVDDRQVGHGFGRTKKEAEQQAAVKALEELEKNA